MLRGKSLGMKYKFSLGFVFCLLCLCLYLFHVIYIEAKQNAIEQLNSRQLIHAKQSRVQIQYIFNSVTTILSRLAKMENVIFFNDSGRRQMKTVLGILPKGVKAISRVDSQGKIIFTAPFNASVIGADISSQAHVKKILSNKIPVASDVFTTVQGYPAIAVHVPVFHDKEFKGTLAILIDFLSVSKRYLEEIKIGDTGYAWMTSQHGIELYCPVPGHTGKSVFKNCKDFPTILTMAKKMVKGEQGVTTYEFNRIKDGHHELVKKHAVYLPIQIVDSFWTIVIASSEKEVLADIVSFKNKLIIIASLLFICISIFLFFSMKAWGVIREDAKRKIAEKALKESEKQYRTLFESSIDALLILDADSGKFVDCNDSAIELYGVRDSRGLIGATPDVLSPLNQPNGTNSHDLAMSFLDMAIKDGSKVFEWQHKKRDNTPFPALVTLSAMNISDKRMVLALVRDLTALKKAEEKKEEQVRTIQRSEEKYRLVVNNVGVGIVILQKKKIVFANKSFMIGLDEKGESLSDYGDMLSLIHEDDIEEVLNKLTYKHLSEIKRDHVQFRIRRSSGEEVWLEVAAVPTKWEKKRAILTFIKDITQLKKMEKEILFINERLTEQNKILREYADKDKLTNIYNRRALQNFIEEQWSRAVRHKTDCSVILLDVDHFKSVNDTYGHQAGDLVLKKLVTIIKHQNRDYDRLGRWGGEEFIVFLPDSTLEDALLIAERFRKAVAETNFQISDKITISITISAGVSSKFKANTIDSDVMIDCADKALYNAKNSGRNKVCFHDKSE